MHNSQSIELQCKFSYSTKNILTNTDNITASLKDLHNLIANPTKAQRVKFVQVQNIARNLFEGNLSKSQSEKLKTQLDYLKKDLGFYFPSGTNPTGHKAENLVFNGFIGLDIDYHHKGGYEKAKAAKAALSKFDFIPFLHHSSGNNGVKGLILTDLKECDSNIYQFAQRQIFAYLSSQGIDLGNDKHAYGKTCYLAYDKNAYLSDTVTPFRIDLEAYEKEKAVIQAQSNRKATVKHDSDEVKQAVDFLIDNKINVANCYNEYLSFTAACLNSFGKSGNDIAFQVLENSDAFNISTFKKDFDNHVKSLSKPDASNKATDKTILFHAKQHGFRYIKKAVLKRLDECQFNNRDLFIVDRKNALEYIKTDKNRKIVVCESSFIDIIEAELSAKRFDSKNVNCDTIVCTYTELSKLPIDILDGAKTYFFGANNLGRKQYINTANEIERISKYSKTILFSDTPIYLHLANSITIIDTHTNNSTIIRSDNPAATFVELTKKHGDTAQFLETSESINRQLQGFEMVKRAELYASDHKKTLYVLYDSNVQLLPQAFAQFKNVVFIVGSEKKECINMSTFCNMNDKATNDALRLIDNDVFRCEIEKMFLETVRNQTFAIRRNNGKMEHCPNIETVLETEHQIKILYSDAEKLQSHIESFTTVISENCEISDETILISDNIKQAKKDLATEKKDEYFEFLKEVEDLNIDSKTKLGNFVASKTDMSRGAKFAYNRIKTLLKAHDSFAICFEAVESSYTGWTQTKGRFCAAKVVKTDTKKGKSLQLFRDTTEGNAYTKEDLIKCAKDCLNVTKGNDKEVWEQLKRVCFISRKRIGRGIDRVTMYEAIFLE